MLLPLFFVATLVVPALDVADVDVAALPHDVAANILPPPLTMDRSSLEKLVLRVEKYPPSNPVAPVDLVGSCA